MSQYFLLNYKINDSHLYRKENRNLLFNNKKKLYNMNGSKKSFNFLCRFCV